MAKKILKLLYRSFDEELNQKEKERLDRALKESEKLRKEKDQILAQRQALAESSASSFEQFFAERVTFLRNKIAAMCHGHLRDLLLHIPPHTTRPR